MQNLASGRNEPVPLFSIQNSIRLWMLHPFLSRVIVDMNKEATLPFIPFLLENLHSKDLPQNFPPRFLSHMSHGTRWFEPIRNTSNYWLEAWESGNPIFFIHLLLFGDGMPIFKMRQQGFQVLTTTCGEFDEGITSFSFSFSFSWK